MLKMTLTLCLLVFQAISAARAETFVYVSVSGEKQIARYRLGADGALTDRQNLSTQGSPGALCVDPQKRFLFGALRSSSQLASFRIDADSGLLRPLSAIDVGASSAFVTTDRAGRLLLSAYYGAGQVAVHRISETGKLIRASGRITPTAKNAHAVTVSPDNQVVYVPHTGPNAIFQFNLNPKTGELTPHAAPRVVRTENIGPRHLWLHPTLPVAYSSDEQGSSVTVFERSAKEGGLRAVQTVSTLPDDFAGNNSTSDVEVTPDGRFVFVANRGHDSLAGFAIDQETGRVRALGQTPTEKTPRSFNIEPQGKFLIAAGQGSGKLAVFQINRETGALKRLHTYEVGKNPAWVMAVEY